MNEPLFQAEVHAYPRRLPEILEVMPNDMKEQFFKRIDLLPCALCGGPSTGGIEVFSSFLPNGTEDEVFIPYCKSCQEVGDQTVRDRLLDKILTGVGAYRTGHFTKQS